MRRRGVIDFSVEIRAAVEEDYTKGSLQILQDILLRYGVWEEA